MEQALPLLDWADEIAAKYRPQPVAPLPPRPAPELGFFGNIARGVKLGAMVDVPEMAGKALQAPSQPGDALYNWGQSLRAGAEARSHLPGYEASPSSWVQAGARGLPVVGGLAALGGAAGLALPEIAGAAAIGGTGGLVSAAAGGALFGGSQYQETFEKGKEAGLSDDQARAAAAGAAGVAGVAGSVAPVALGRFARGIAPVLNTAPTTIEGVAQGFANRPFWSTFGKSAAEQAAVMPTLMAGQAAATAGIEQAAGIPGPGALEAAQSTVMPTLSMVALSLPFGAMGIGWNNRKRAETVSQLESPQTPTDQRARAVVTVSAEMRRVDKNAAKAWEEAALDAIYKNQPVKISSDFAPWWKSEQDRIVEEQQQAQVREAGAQEQAAAISAANPMLEMNRSIRAAQAESPNAAIWRGISEMYPAADHDVADVRGITDRYIQTNEERAHQRILEQVGQMYQQSFEHPPYAPTARSTRIDETNRVQAAVDQIAAAQREEFEKIPGGGGTARALGLGVPSGLIVPESSGGKPRDTSATPLEKTRVIRQQVPNTPPAIAARLHDVPAAELPEAIREVWNEKGGVNADAGYVKGLADWYKRLTGNDLPEVRGETTNAPKGSGEPNAASSNPVRARPEPQQPVSEVPTTITGQRNEGVEGNAPPIANALKNAADAKVPAPEVSAPESPVAAAVVRFGGKQYEDVNHILAVKKALADNAVPKDEKGRVTLGPNDTMNLFRLKDGRIVTRDEVGEMLGGKKRTEELEQVYGKLPGPGEFEGTGRPVGYGEMGANPPAGDLDAYYKQYLDNFKNRHTAENPVTPLTTEQYASVKEARAHRIVADKDWFWHEGHSYPAGGSINQKIPFLTSVAEGLWYANKGKDVPEAVSKIATALNFMVGKDVSAGVQKRAKESFTGWTPENIAAMTREMGAYLKALEVNGKLGRSASEVLAVRKAALEESFKRLTPFEKRAQKVMHDQRMREMDAEILKVREQEKVNELPDDLGKALQRGVDAYTYDQGLKDQISNTKGDVIAAAKLIAAEHPSAFVRQVASAISKLNLGTTIYESKDPDLVGGVFHPDTNTIELGRGGMNSLTLMHEMVHAAGHAAISRGMNALDAIASGAKRWIDFTPKEREEIAAVKQMQQIYDEFKRKAPIADPQVSVAMIGLQDFYAEAMANTHIQELLGAKTQAASMWTRIADAVRRFFGIDRGPIDQLMRMKTTLFGDVDRTAPAFFSPKARFDPNIITDVTGSLNRAWDKVAEKAAGERLEKWLMDVTSVNHQSQMLKNKVTDWAAKYPALKPALDKIGESFGGVYRTVRLRAGMHSGLTMQYRQVAKDMVYLQKLDAKNFDVMGSMAMNGSRLGVDPRISFGDAVTAHEKTLGRPMTPKEMQAFSEKTNSPAAKELRDQYQKLKQVSDQMTAQAAPGERVVTPVSVYHSLILENRLSHMREMRNRTGDLIKTWGLEKNPRFEQLLKDSDVRDLMMRNDSTVPKPEQLQILSNALHDINAMVGVHSESVLNRFAQEYSAPKEGPKATLDDWVRHLNDMQAGLEGAARESLVGHINEAQNAAGLKSAINNLHSIFRARLEAPYFHLGRSGDYMVRMRVKDDVPNSTEHWDAVGAVVGRKFNEGGLEREWGPMSATGNRDVYMRFEDEGNHIEAVKRIQQLLQAGHIESEYTAGKLSGDRWSTDSASPLFLKEQIKQIRKMSWLSPADQNDVIASLRDTWLASLPETSALKASMFRDGDLGYSSDFIKSVVDRQEMAHSAIASTWARPFINEALRDSSDAMTELRAGTAAHGLPAEAVQVANEMQLFANEQKTRLKSLQTPVASPTIDKMRAVTAAWFLAGSPAYLVMNAYQPWQVSMPFLGAKYGFVESAFAMKNASAKAMMLTIKAMKLGWGAEKGGAWDKIDGVASLWIKFGESTKRDGVTPMVDKNQLDLLGKLQWSGLLSFGLTNEIARMNAADLGKVAKVTRIASIFSHYVETTNRLSTALAAYDLATRAPNGVPKMDHEAAVQFAMQSVRNFDMDHSQANIARAFGRKGWSGRSTPLFVGFQNYNLQMIELIGRTAAEAFGSNTAQRTEARRALAGMFVTTAAMAGVLGLPFVGLFSALANRIAAPFDDSDNPWDVQKAFRDTVADLFGKQVGEIVSRGLPRLIDVDMSQRSGFQDMVPFTDFFLDKRKIEDKIADGALTSLGPAVGTIGNMVAGLYALHQHDYPKVLNDMLPVMVRNWAKSIWLANNGFEAGGLGHNPIPIGINGTNQANFWQVIQQAGGFTSGTKAEYQERSQYFRNDQLMLQKRREIIQEQLYKAYEAQDWEKISDLWQQAMEFSMRNPVQAISGQAVGQGLKARAEERAVGGISGGMLVSPHLAPLLPKYNQF